MPRYQRGIYLAIATVLMVVYNNCGQVQFQPTSLAGLSSTSGSPGGSNSVPGGGCSSTAFGTTCNGGSTPPPSTVNTGAHGFFYNLTPIPDANANSGVAGSMSLLNPQSLISDLSVYSTELNVADQNWTQGFPGFPTLQEWFGVCYDGSWTATTQGTYTFVTAVDDAVAIYIDGTIIGENDGGTVNQSPVATFTGEPFSSAPVAFKSVSLAAGVHSVEIMYYQGWPTALELQVWALPPGTSFPSGSTPSNSNLMQLGAPLNGVLNCPH